MTSKKSMDYHNLKKKELIKLVKELKEKTKKLEEEQKIQKFLYDINSYTYIKFNKNGVIKYTDNKLIYDDSLNALRYKNIKEIKTTENKNLEDYFNNWQKEKLPQTIKLGLDKYKSFTYKCLFLEDNFSDYICILSDITELDDLKTQYEFSEAKFRQIFDDLKIGISVLNRDFQIVFANKKMKEYFPNIVENAGMICYKTYNDPPSKEPCSYCPSIKTLKDGEIYETITETPAGSSIRYFLLRSSPIKDSNNQVQYILELVEDISEKIKIEESINFQNTFLKYLIESIPAGIFYKDLDLKYIGCNKRFADTFDLKPEEIINKTSYDLYNPEDAKKFEELDKELINTRRLQTYEFQFNNSKKGKIEYYLLHKAPYYDSAGNIKGIIGITLNITDIKEIGNKLQESFDLINDLIEQTDSIVVNLDMEGNIRIFNKAAEKITGYKREEVIGKNYFHLFVPPKKYPDVFNLFTEFKKRKTVTRDYYINNIITKSGKERLIKWRNNLFKKDNKVVGITSIGVDITEENEFLVDKLLNLIEIIPHPILIMDDNFIITYINTAYSKLTGYKPEDIIGNSFTINKSNDFNKETYKKMLAALKDGNKWSCEYIAEKKDGELYYENIHITPIKDTSGNIKYYIVIRLNINDYKNLLTDLQNQKEKKEELEKQIILLSLILKYELDVVNRINKDLKNYKHKDNTIETLSESLLRIDDFKILFDKFIKKESLKSSKLKKIFLRNILKEIITKYESNFLNNNIKITIDKNLDKVNINNDEEIIRFILQNLILIIKSIIKNGTIKFSLNKNKKYKNYKFALEISVKSKESIDRELLTIKNNFDNISNLDDSNLSENITKLYLLKMLLENNNSALYFEILNKSELKFIILFSSAIKRVSIDTSEKKMKKLLLAEDNISNAEIIKMFLEEKFEVKIVSSANEAIAEANKNKFDIFLIDIDLGNGDDGIQILKELKKLDKYLNSPFIAVTGYTHFRDRQKFLDTGFCDYLSKPFRKEQLINSINKFL